MGLRRSGRKARRRRKRLLREDARLPAAPAREELTAAPSTRRAERETAGLAAGGLRSCRTGATGLEPATSGVTGPSGNLYFALLSQIWASSWVPYPARPNQFGTHSGTQTARPEGRPHAE